MVHLPPPQQPEYNDLINRLNSIAEADKSNQWIHSDLTVSSSSGMGRFFWSLLSFIPVIGKTIRNAIFNTDLEEVNRKLNDLKPIVQTHSNQRLKNIFAQAVTNFTQIAPKYQTGFENIEAPLTLKRITLSPAEKTILSSYMQQGQKAVKEENLINYLETKYKIKQKEIKAAAQSFALAIGSIVHAKGVIQDPAGTAIGSKSIPAKSGAGGLSRAIYSKFPELHEIPSIVSGNSIFNSGPSDSNRILHTHSPLLSKAQNIHEAIDLIKKAYYNAINTFLDNTNHGQTTLNLCAISASLYGRPYVSQFGQEEHLDPSITLLALTAAIVDIQRERAQDLEGKTINLFFRGSGQAGSDRSPITEKAQSVFTAIK
jgi:hypothetical protein